MFTDKKLIDNGKTCYVIVIPDQSTASEGYAAKLLQNIFMRCGVEIPVVREGDNYPDTAIMLGDTKAGKAIIGEIDAKTLTTDGYCIRSGADGSVVLNGGGEWGKIYSVLGLAERCLGYKYYARDEIAITAESSVPLPVLDILDKPAFVGRDAFNYDTHSDTEHSVQLRLNGFYVKWQEWHGEGTPWSSLNDQSLVKQILPHNEYMGKHPDWYYTPYDNGSNALKTQICFTKGLYDRSEGGMFRTFVDNLIDRYIIPEKGKKFFMLGITDNDHFCNCPDCTRDIGLYTKSGVSMRLINAVADEVERWRQANAPEREIYLVTFAYAAVFDAPVREEDGKFVPVHESVIARPNVIVRYAPISANYSKSIVDPVHNAAARKSILGWSTVCSKMAVWDYRVDFHAYFAPYPQWHSIKQNLLAYVDAGVVDIFHQGCRPTGGTPFAALDNYVRSRLLWDITLDPQELTQEFVEVFYKDMAKYIWEYREYLNKHYEEIFLKHNYLSRCHENLLNPVFWKYESIMDIKGIFDRAYEELESKYKDSPAYAVMKLRLDTESIFYRFMLAALYSDWYTKKEYSELVDGLEAAAKAANFTVVKSGIAIVRDLPLSLVISHFRKEADKK